MNSKIFPLSFLFLLTFSAATCKKENTLEMELAKLPPATQTGQNTFGCLVNGKAWVAQNADCFPYCDPSFKMYYDGYRGGSLSIITVNIDSRKKISERLTLAFDSAKFKTVHKYNNVDEIKFSYTDYNGINCNDFHSVNQDTYTIGTVTITKSDFVEGIISGTFEFTLFKPGCDTIKVTDGRFDKKL